MVHLNYSKVHKTEDNLVDIEIDLPVDTLDYLQSKADSEGVDLNTCIVSLLEDYLQEQSKPKRPVQEVAKIKRNWRQRSY